MPAYSDLTRKLQHFTMEASDWTALSKHVGIHRACIIKLAYSARERGDKTTCAAELPGCRFREEGEQCSLCTYAGFCTHQKP